MGVKEVIFSIERFNFCEECFMELPFFVYKFISSDELILIFNFNSFQEFIKFLLKSKSSRDLYIFSSSFGNKMNGVCTFITSFSCVVDGFRVEGTVFLNIFIGDGISFKIFLFGYSPVADISRGIFELCPISTIGSCSSRF